MGRPLKLKTLTPMGRIIYARTEEKGFSLIGVTGLLGWPKDRIYGVMRSGSVRVEWVRQLAEVLGLEVEVLLGLETRGGEDDGGER